MKATVYISNPGKDQIVFANPFDGMAQVYIGLENRTGRKFSIRKDLAPIVSGFFRGATIVPSHGLWKGKMERSAVVTIIADLRGSRKLTLRKNWDRFVSVVEQMADLLAKKFAQEGVMVQFTPPGVTKIRLR